MHLKRQKGMYSKIRTGRAEGKPPWDNLLLKLSDGGGIMFSEYTIGEVGSLLISLKI